MTTALQMIEKAARLIGMTAQGQSLSAEEAADGLSALNDMLHAWALDGIILGHTSLGLNDTIYIQEEYMKGVRYNLALEMAADIPMDPPQFVFLEARQLKSAIEANNVNPVLMEVDAGLLRPARGRTLINE